MQSVQLQSLLKSTNFISQELSAIKQDLEKPARDSTNPLSYIERAIKLRQSFRSIADGIEAKRSLTQLQKEKIQKSKNYIQGLQYYKATLINKIKQSQLQSLDLNQFFQEPLQVRDWVKDYQLVQEHMKKEISRKQAQKNELQQLHQQKNAKEKERKFKKQLHQTILPEKAKMLREQALEIAKLSGMDEHQSICGVSNPSLSKLIERLMPLRIDGTIQMSLSKDLNEEIQIVICKKGYHLYKTAQSNKIPLEEKQIKIIISTLSPESKNLVIGLDRREDFNNQEVFQRLINSELIKPVYTRPKNQSERNTNAKFISVDWIQNSVLNGIVHALDFINLIKERIFSLMLINYMKDNMKKINFFFPLFSDEEKYGNSLPSNLKKPMSGSLDKISFTEFLETVHVPSWIEKYHIKYEELKNKKETYNYEEQKDFKINKNNYLNVLKMLKLEEIDEENLNQYFKGTLNLFQNNIEFVLIVPFAYPQKHSSIVITNWQKKKEEEKKPQGLEGVPCLSKVSPPKKMFSSKLLAFEKTINDQMDQFLKDTENEPFRVLLQINRLISLLGLHAQKRI